MIEKLKSYASYLFGLAILVLSAMLFRKSKQLDETKSELAANLAKGAIRENEAERQMARDNANALVDEYERLKRE